jgi:hypothetical protein
MYIFGTGLNCQVAKNNFFVFEENLIEQSSFDTCIERFFTVKGCSWKQGCGSRLI